MLQFDPFSAASLMFTLVVLTFFIVLRYFMIAGFFYWALWLRSDNLLHARRLAQKSPTAKLIRHEIRWSVISSVIYAAAGVLIIEAWRSGYTRIYFDVADYGVVYLLLSVPLYLFLHDTYFYWTHRIMHHPKIFTIMHRVHHESRQPTPWAGFSFHPWEALVGAAVVPLLVFLIPIHVGALIFLLILMTITGVTNHAGYELLPDSWMRGPYLDWSFKEQNQATGKISNDSLQTEPDADTQRTTEQGELVELKAQHSQHYNKTYG